jgi:heme-degrading monooxygenase HmoA
MSYVITRIKVADYARWKEVFDAGGAFRQSYGSQGGRLFRSASDPNELILLTQWDNLEKARQFAQSEELKADVQKAGHLGQPDVYFLEEVEPFSR